MKYAHWAEMDVSAGKGAELRTIMRVAKLPLHYNK